MKTYLLITTTIAAVLMLASVGVFVGLGIYLKRQWRERDEIERKQKEQIREMAQGGYPFLHDVDDPDFDDGADSFLDEYGNDGSGNRSAGSAGHG